MFRWIEGKTLIVLAGVLMLVVMMTLRRAEAAQVQDLVRLKGSESNRLVGFGLVTGLSGTGDGGKFKPTARVLAQALSRFVDARALAEEMKDADNVALVQVTATLPATGVREGSLVDVEVSAVAAESLAGGQLFMTPLVAPGPNGQVFAFAAGPIVVEDMELPTTGVVSGGAQMIHDVRTQLTDAAGRITLILDEPHASWSAAHLIAQQINGAMAPEGPVIAAAVDAANVVVQLPPWERDAPAAFVSRMLELYIDSEYVAPPARVVINEKTGTIVVGGDVEISPVLVSHRGLTMTTVQPPLEPTALNPQVESHPFISMDPQGKGGASLENLQAAFDQLKVPAEDRIDILKLLKRSGYLHAQLILE